MPSASVNNPEDEGAGKLPAGETKKIVHTPKRSSTAWVQQTDLADESIVMTSKNVRYFPPVNKGVSIKGTLDVTNFKLKFTPTTDSNLDLIPDGLFCIPLTTVWKMNLKRVDPDQSRRDGRTEIYVRCKDARHLRFEVRDEILTIDKLQLMFDAYLYPGNPKYLFAFDHKYPHVSTAPGKGWDVYSLQKEMVRMGLRATEAFDSPHGSAQLAKSVRMTKLNQTYGLCQTYPKLLLVPSSAEDRLVRECAGFRTKGRLPTMTFAHPKGGSIWRGSQPRIGLGGATNRSDEAYLYAMAATSPRAGPKILIITDCRPKVNAYANRGNGGGFEGNSYRSARLKFWDIQNIHAMRGSYEKLANITMNDGNDLNFGGAVEDSGWLQHIRCCLRAAIYSADQVRVQQRAVLIHCSDGWDRTPQLCSLAQIMLDPYFRTIEGFQVLVQKSWLSFGHRVHYRTGHGEKPTDDNSPIFFQFLDCVWQLTNQFPTAFEYNDAMLLDVADNLWSCRFGTFLLNCDRERDDMDLSKKTTSLWSFVDHERARYVNPHFDRSYPDALKPRFSAVARQVTLWKSFWLRYCPVLSSHPCPMPSKSLAGGMEEYLLQNKDAIAHYSTQALKDGGAAAVDNEKLLATIDAVTKMYALKFIEAGK
jgi:hypothetical protein